MNKRSIELNCLIATDFDESVFSKYRQNPKIHHGGWIVNRTPYDFKTMINDVNKLNITVLVVEVEDVPDLVFENCPNLAVVASLRANPVNVDLKSAEQHGVVVLHAPGRNAQAVAELTICLILDLLRHVSTSSIDMRSGNWGAGIDDPYLRFRGNELKGKTVGLIGFGAIGQSVARVLSGFYVRILAYDPYQPETIFDKFGVETIDLKTLLEKADIISIHTPINEDTRGMLGMNKFGLMKSDSILINTARAALIDREALYLALKQRRIAAAALDVHYEEPPLADEPLFALPNVLITPHIGGATREVITRGSEMIVADLDRILTGNKPNHAAVFPNNPRLFTKKYQTKDKRG